MGNKKKFIYLSKVKFVKKILKHFQDLNGEHKIEESKDFSIDRQLVQVQLQTGLNFSRGLGATSGWTPVLVKFQCTYVANI